MQIAINLDGNDIHIENIENLECAMGKDSKVGVLRIAYDRIPAVITYERAMGELALIGLYGAAIDARDGQYVLYTEAGEVMCSGNKLILSGVFYIMRRTKAIKRDKLTAAEITD